MSVRRVLLRQGKRRLYFQQPDEWVADAEKACLFKGSVEAERLATERGFKEVEVVFEFDTPEHDFAMGL